MRKALIPAFLLVLGSLVLGATVFRDPLANAAAFAQSVFISNGTSDPVPVAEQNRDAAGNIRVHEQGTANVNVTNSTLPVHEQGTADVHVTNGSLSVAEPTPVTDGGGYIQCQGGRTCPLNGPVTATALSIYMTSDGGLTVLHDGSTVPAEFLGPNASPPGPDTIVLALTRPVTFDSVECIGWNTGRCTVSWVGNSPGT